MKSFVSSILLSIFVVVSDQLSKYLVKTNMVLGESIPIINGLFNLTFVKNAGVAFGMGSGAHPEFKTIFFLGLPVAACLWLVYLIWHLHGKKVLSLISYALILGGAVGNLIDRFTTGLVVDFFDFYFKNSHFATFNVADSAITVAAFLLILEFIIEKKRISSK